MSALFALDPRAPRADVSTVYVRELCLRDATAECVVAIGDHRARLYLSAPGWPVRGAADAFLALTLVPALMLGADLDIEGAASTGAVAAADRVQALFTRWFPSLSRVALRVGRVPDHPRAAGAASMFSGGVDSWHTLLRRRDDLTHAILVHGFDLGEGGIRLPEAVASAMREGVRRVGLSIIEVETNARRWCFDLAAVLGFRDRYLVWSFAHGAALAAVGFALAAAAGRVVIPSSDSGESPVPWGSHPDLDPLWSGPAVTFEHDECATPRIEKLAAIATSEIALPRLRVCWASPPTGFNCGRCEKCRRTIASLHALGAADGASTLPPIGLAAVAATRITAGSVPYWREIEDFAQRRGRHRAAAAVGAVLTRHRRAARIARVRRAVSRLLPAATRGWSR